MEQENPIKKLIQSGHTVYQLAEKTGMTHQALRVIARMTKDDIQNVRLGTVKKIYDSLGVSLYDYYMSK